MSKDRRRGKSNFQVFKGFLAGCRPNPWNTLAGEAGHWNNDITVIKD